jgi:hypothetical protein
MTQNNMEVVAGKWLLMKRGLYWMPNSQGYTGLKSEAGRYTDEEVAVYRRNDERGVFILEAETADEIAPKCWPDVAQRHLRGLLTSAQAEIAIQKQANEALMRERATMIATHREQLERLTKARDSAIQAVDAFADICDELGCERDNEAGLQAVHALKQERDALMAIVVDCLDSANVLLETKDPAALDYIIQELRDGAALQPLEPKND